MTPESIINELAAKDAKEIRSLFVVAVKEDGTFWLRSDFGSLPDAALTATLAQTIACNQALTVFQRSQRVIRPGGLLS